MGRRTTYRRKKKGQPATDSSSLHEDEPATTSQSIVIQTEDEDSVQEQSDPDVEPDVSQVKVNMSFEAQIESLCDGDACDEDSNDSDSECVDFQDEMTNFENIMTHM